MSMQNDDTFKQTAQYQIYYFPTCRFASCFASTTPPHISTINGHGIAGESSGHRGRGHLSGQSYTWPTMRPRDPHECDLSSDDEGELEAPGAPPRPYYVISQPSTSHSSPSSSDSDDMPPDINRARPVRSPNQDDILAQFDFDEVLRRGAVASADRRARAVAAPQPTLPDSDFPTLTPDFGTAPSHIPYAAASPHPTPTTANNSSSSNININININITTDNGGRRPSIDLLTPKAGFSMRKDGKTPSKTTIPFSPPVSGKFILLKMWNARHGGNIDLQSIVAYGYAGPRLFPSVEPR